MIERQRSLPFGRSRRKSGSASRLRRVRPGKDPAGRAREALRRSQFDRLMGRLRADAERIASHFDLRYRALRIERPTARSHYGICYDDGTIKIRLNHAVYLRPLRYSSLVNTVCHELAHLRHFDHGEGFKGFYAEILEWARAQRIYRPAGKRPHQGDLELALPENCEVEAAEARFWLKTMRGSLPGG
ncbi:MAG: YgjP-like metallopeptidase domain-containing protein [Acidobacteriota bacterium]